MTPLSCSRRASRSTSLKCMNPAAPEHQPGAGFRRPLRAIVARARRQCAEARRMVRTRARVWRVPSIVGHAPARGIARAAMVRATDPGHAAPLAGHPTRQLSPEELARKDAWVRAESARLDRELHGSRWTSRVPSAGAPRHGLDDVSQTRLVGLSTSHALIDERGECPLPEEVAHDRRRTRRGVV